MEAQKTDSISYNRARLDSLNDFFSHQDSLLIFDLIDSLFMLEALKPPSQLAVSIAYNSNVDATIGPINLDKFGMSAGLSYYHNSGVYANLNLVDADPRLVAAYGANTRRLVDLKTQYDPTNLFHMNPNIPPRSAG